MKLNSLLLFIVGILFSASGFSQLVSGNVHSTDGTVLPFASVYLEDSTFGVSTDSRGNYQIELPNGKHFLVFSFVGFELVKKEVLISGGHEILNVSLEPVPNVMAAAEIVGNSRARAKSIMEKVREKRKVYKKNLDAYTADFYTKITLDEDSVILKLKQVHAQRFTGQSPDSLKHGLLLKEYAGQVNYKRPGRYKEIISAYRDYQDREIPAIGKSISLTYELERNDIAPMTERAQNEFLIYRGFQDSEFDFYDNLIEFPGMVVQALLSPIAYGSNLKYKYDFEGVFEENGIKIHQVRCSPLFASDALFSGLIFIEDSTWALRAVDLEINSKAQTVCERFRIIQHYDEIMPGKYLITRRDVQYSVKNGPSLMLGRTESIFNNHDVNPSFPVSYFNGEIIRYELGALEKGPDYWANRRPVVLNESEQKFISHADSIDSYLGSDEYFQSIDSAFNKINWWAPLVGVGHRNREKGREWYISGLLEQINPLGIGGYRHKLPGYFNQTLKNDHLLEVDGFVDYGFRNEDVKGRVGVGWTYKPEKAIRTYIRVGDYYEMINNYASIEQIFSRSNYIRTKKAYVAQRLELINGLYGELSFEYTDQQPLKDLALSVWSNDLFGELNNPADFKRYTKSEIQLELLYRIKQKYIWKRGRKEILGTDHPVLNLKYRRGIKGLFNSETDYDLLEISAEHNMNLAQFGSLYWKVGAGSFLNKKNLRLLEHKYFRGSDRFFFSDPTISFQLLGPTLSTPDAYFQANFMHHFNGSILGKIPFINRTKIQVAAGGGLLLLDQDNFQHAELFGGLERVFNVKGELLRLGIFAVTSDNSIDKATYTFKIGLNFYNTFTRKWDY